MVKKSRGSRRSSSRKMKHTRKHKTSRRHTRRHRVSRRRGGADALNGAAVNYSLSGSWPSRMSLGQGADYFKYHVGQHGGAGAPLSAIGATLPPPLRGPAHLTGIDKAINDVLPLKDQAGGKRKKNRKASKKHRKSHKKSHSRKHRRTHHKRRGGALGFAPFPVASGMLLSSPTAYAQAGLNPQWKTDVAFEDARIRETQ